KGVVSRPKLRQPLPTLFSGDLWLARDSILANSHRRAQIDRGVPLQRAQEFGIPKIWELESGLGDCSIESFNLAQPHRLSPLLAVLHPRSDDGKDEPLEQAWSALECSLHEAGDGVGLAAWLPEIPDTDPVRDGSESDVAAPLRGTGRGQEAIEDLRDLDAGP